MKSYFKDLFRKTSIVVLSIIFGLGIVYAAISWPSSAPDGETSGGKFTGVFTKILANPDLVATDGTVKKARESFALSQSCGANQAIQGFNADGTVKCMDMLENFTYSWSSSDWSACTKTCGGGTQDRTVQCLRNGTLVVADSYCAGAKPATSQSCNVQGCCPKYQYSKNGTCTPIWDYTLGSPDSYTKCRKC